MAGVVDDIKPRLIAEKGGFVTCATINLTGYRYNEAFRNKEARFETFDHTRRIQAACGPVEHVCNRDRPAEES